MKAYVGVDLGTQGCRAMVAKPDGSVASSAYEHLDAQIENLPSRWSEQDASRWWPSVRSVTRKAMGSTTEAVGAVCVDSTSGTLLAIDRGGHPLTPAIMYNDGRAIDEARLVSEVGGYLEEKLGYKVRPSFAIAKLLWLKRKRGRIFDSAYGFVHAADLIAGRLIGRWSSTDHTNALKSCFDLIDYKWPDFFEDLGIPTDKMPSVVPPGEEIGRVTKEASRETGIPEGTPVVAGLTDGCAAQVASGAAGVGDWESTLGTTLVVKGVTRDLIKDPQGRIYSHLHPERCWMPGGASSTGGEILSKDFHGDDLPELDRKAKKMLPTGLTSYPLARRGERFPFVSSEAEGFVVGVPKSRVHLYAAHLEGVAYLERMAYDTLRGLGASIGDRLFTAGGGAKSQVWLQVRANVLQSTILRPRVPEAAMGVAILGASSDLGMPLGQLARRMVRIDLTVRPNEELAAVYDDGYRRFRSEISQRFKLYTNV